jgi:hypothetical protein
MRTTLAVIASLLLVLSPLAVEAQDSKAALEAVAKALGADAVTSDQILPLHGRVVPLAEMKKTIGRE